MIDVRDTEFVWCIGKVLKIESNSLVIHYEGWHKQYDEEILLDSSRLANYGCYTMRNNIPRYLIKGENNCLCHLMIPDKTFNTYSIPLLDTVDKYYNYENSKVCD